MVSAALVVGLGLPMLTSASVYIQKPKGTCPCCPVIPHGKWSITEELKRNVENKIFPPF